MFRSVVLAAVLLAAASGASRADERKDLQIFNDIARQVNSYVYFTVFDDVNASVEGGVVTLTGKVTMPYKRSDIEKRIERVEGVREVRNQLQVLPVSPFDEELRYEIARAIYGNPSFWTYAAMANPPIHIVVDRGHVTLTGVVTSEVQRMLARSLASSSGAFSITNALRTDAEAADELERT
jgi:hyperosmotically inducible protein